MVPQPSKRPSKAPPAPKPAPPGIPVKSPSEKAKEKVSKGVSSILVVTSLIALAVSILLFAFSRPLSAAFFGGVDATFYVKIAAFLVFLASFDQIVVEYFPAFQQI